MSFVGKLLLVLNVVASVCFMAFAAAVSATQTNWKENYAKLKAELDNQRSASVTLQADYKKLQDDSAAQLSARQNEIQNLTVTNTQLTAQVQTLTQENQNLKNTATVKTQLTNIADENSIFRRQESLTLRELLKEAQAAKDAEFAARSQLEDRVYELTRDHQRLTDDYKALLRENGKFKQVLAANNLPYEIQDYDRGTQPPPRGLEGKVLGSKKFKGQERVEISLGKEDGIDVGHRLMLYHSGLADGSRSQYIGIVVIETVEPDRAVGYVVDKAPNRTIQEGDNVTTSL